MSELSLRQIERRSWKATMQGGLIEILFGIMMLAGAVSCLITDLGAPSAAGITVLIALHAVGLLLMFWIRKRYVLPRVGRVVFGATRKRRLRWMIFLLTVCVLATITLVVLTVLAQRTEISLLGPISATPIVAIVTVIVLVPLGAMSLFLDSPRFLLLGGMIVAAEGFCAVFEHIGTPPHHRTLVYGILGVVSLTIGSVTFTRFVRRIPRHNSGVIGYEA